MPSLLTTTPSAGHWRAAGLVALTLAAVSMLALPVADRVGPEIPAFLPAYGMAVLLTEVMTAYLLFGQGSMARRADAALLGVAYLYGGLMVLPHILTYPGVFGMQGWLGAGPQTAVWLWVLWHGGYPLILLLFAFVAGSESGARLGRVLVRRGSGPLVLGTLLTVGGLTLLTTAGHDLLPEIIRQGDYHRLVETGLGPLVWMLNALALFAFVRTTRLATLPHLWVAVALLATLLNVTVTLAGGARFSLGWYVARLNSLAAAGIMLLLFLRAMIDSSQRIQQLNILLERQALVDPLTGIANRRCLDLHLEAEWRRAQRGARPLSLVMIDLDHFKCLNDALGHVEGDRALQLVGRVIGDFARRPGDLAARFGGEEFVLLLPETGQEAALAVANRVREAVATLNLPNPGGTEGRLTISLGVACLGTQGGGTAGPVADPTLLLEMADAALYRAKRAGRNRVAGPQRLALGGPVPVPV